MMNWFERRGSGKGVRSYKARKTSQLDIQWLKLGTTKVCFGNSDMLLLSAYTFMYRFFKL